MFFSFLRNSSISGSPGRFWRASESSGRIVSANVSMASIVVSGQLKFTNNWGGMNGVLGEDQREESREEDGGRGKRMEEGVRGWRKG
mmetsp:Transcript_25343/g.61036  ORF Transcript_25343/g.61036 Transcript_25343/m.61036 type:complete len:87 (+) Transcript_25343:698-958(+)